MVCKEDVLLWFKDLESYKRIDVVYELLTMCLPFELRFVGTCVEEIGKHTYQELRGPELIANDLDKLSKDVTFDQGLSERSVRHRVLVYLSLLSSRNFSVANWFYTKLLRTQDVEQLVSGGGRDDMVQSELLLLFTMALHHPAFNFDHKQHFCKVLSQLIAFRESRSRMGPHKSNVIGCPPGFGYPAAQTKLLQDIGEIEQKRSPPPMPTVVPLTPSQMEFMQLNRPGFPCEIPYVTPLSPLVSQTGSPNHSRSTSPLRAALTIRPLPPMTHVDIPLPPISSEPQSSLYNSVDDEIPQLPDADKLGAWPTLVPPLQPINSEIKTNGMRFAPFPTSKHRPPFIVDQIQALNLDGDTTLQQQSNSSSNSSPNLSPPGTPAAIGGGMVAASCRGSEAAAKGRLNNGLPPPPPPSFGGPPPPMCDAVPYNFTQTFTALPPNRSIFHFNNYRPQFSAPYPYQTDSFPTYTLPYIVYSSQYPPRNPTGCFNCGAHGHVGAECAAQKVDEITQNKSYQLEFAATVPDRDK